MLTLMMMMTMTMKPMIAMRMAMKMVISDCAGRAQYESESPTASVEAGHRISSRTSARSGSATGTRAT
eukprot:4150681-Pyramimonas_sp.AAC.1